MDSALIPAAPGPTASETSGAADELTALDAFGLGIAKRRREAIDGRQLQGIEQEWLEDEEHYIGVDDANRGEYRSTWRQTKPVASTGQWSTESATKAKQHTKSTIFVNITRPYVDAAAARLADMLLPADDRCWDLEPTPIPELSEAAKSEAMVQIDAAGTMVSEKELAEAIMETAKEYTARGVKRIDDWMTEGQFTARTRECIESAAKLGTGVIKGPVPIVKRKLSWSFAGMQSQKSVTQETVPQSLTVDPWNFFPDPACGTNIQDGEYVFERDYITRKRLLRLKREEGYIAEQIDRCIDEGPIQPELVWTPSMEIDRTQGMPNQPFEVWYYHGTVEIEELISAGVDVSAVMMGEDGQPARYVDAIVTMVNHRVIHAALKPLDDGTFPYDLMVWQKRPGMPWGMGVARQGRTAQRMLNAAARNLMDNAALSAGPQVVIDSNAIIPVDGVWEVRPLKAWIARANADPVEVDKAFRIVSIETRQPELLNIINLALRFAEESTGLPMILQGQQGEKSTDTLGGLQLLQNNASAVLRRLARTFDEGFTIPHVTRYYVYLMEYGPDESEKGDYAVVAKGSSTLVERDLQNQEIILMTQLSENPIYGLDPVKTAEEYLRSRRFDPKRFKPDGMEEGQSMMPGDPASDPAVLAADTQAASDRDALKAQLDDKERDRQARREEKLLELNSKHALFNAESALKEKEGTGI